MTDLEAFSEIGCVQFENAIILDLDMKNIPIDKITKKWGKFNYEPPFTEWHKYLSKPTYNPNELIKVRIKKRLWDLETNKHYVKNDIIDIRQTRASELEAKDIVEIL